MFSSLFTFYTILPTFILRVSFPLPLWKNSLLCKLTHESIAVPLFMFIENANVWTTNFLVNKISHIQVDWLETNLLLNVCYSVYFFQCYVLASYNRKMVTYKSILLRLAYFQYLLLKNNLNQSFPFPWENFDNFQRRLNVEFKFLFLFFLCAFALMHYFLIYQ